MHVIYIYAKFHKIIRSFVDNAKKKKKIWPKYNYKKCPF